jgi:hypothetical protein
MADTLDLFHNNNEPVNCGILYGDILLKYYSFFLRVFPIRLTEL